MPSFSLSFLSGHTALTPYYIIKIYNNLPTGIKQISHDTIKFKKAVKRFLLDKSFYSLDEYYKWKENIS